MYLHAVLASEGIPEAQKHKTLKTLVPEKRQEEFYFPNSLRQFSVDLYFPTKVFFPSTAAGKH